MKVFFAFLVTILLVVAVVLTLIVEEKLKAGSEVWCILRKVDGHWQCLNDENHESVGVSSVSSDNTYVIMNFDKPASKIRGFVCAHDDADNYGGWSIGWSIGLSSASGVIRNASGKAQNPSTLPNSGSGNFQCHGNIRP